MNLFIISTYFYSSKYWTVYGVAMRCQIFKAKKLKIKKNKKKNVVGESNAKLMDSIATKLMKLKKRKHQSNCYINQVIYIQFFFDAFAFPHPYDKSFKKNNNNKNIIIIIINNPHFSVFKVISFFLWFFSLSSFFLRLVITISLKV